MRLEVIVPMMRTSRSPLLQGALALLLPLSLAATPAAAQSMSDRQSLLEQEACEARLAGQVEDPASRCQCMVNGLTTGLDDEAYAALSAMLAGGSETEAGLQAQETARQIVAGCLEG